MAHLIKSICLALIISCFTIYQSSSQTVNRKVTENLIGKINSAEIIGNSITYSKNMLRIAYRIKNGDKFIAVVDGKNGNSYEFVSVPAFSPDGKQYACVARIGSNWLLILNGNHVAIETESEITAVYFYPDSKNYIYTIKKENRYSVVVNNIKGKFYESIDENSITFSADSKTIAYSAGMNDRQCNVVDGKESLFFDKVGFPILSVDGNHNAFWAIDGKEVFVILDNQKGKPYEAINSLILSNNGLHCAYSVTQKGKRIVVFDNLESEKYDWVHSLIFSADGNRFAYAMEHAEGDKEGFKQYVMVDGNKEGPYETVVEGTLKFSDDGNKIVFKVEKQDEFFIVCNGKEGKRYGDVLQITTVFSPDNQRLAYAVENNSKRMVVIDDKESVPYNDVFAISYSPDSRHCAYSVKIDDKVLVVVDGQKGEKYDSMLGQGEIVFDTSKSFHYFTVKGNNVYLIEETIL